MDANDKHNKQHRVLFFSEYYTSALWLATYSYTLHIYEEYQLDHPSWIKEHFGLNVDWANFAVTNAVVVLSGICSSFIGWKKPAVALAFPALMIVNAIFFHILPTVKTGIYSPGVITAVLTQIPAALFCFYGALKDGVGVFSVLLGSVLGVLFMALPFLTEVFKKYLKAHNNKIL